jgi:uncharacterized protein
MGESTRRALAAPTLRPVPGVPVLLLAAGDGGRNRTLLVADVHLGLGGTPPRPSGPPGGTAEEMADELLRVVRSERARSIVFAGDVKHPIVGTPPSLRPAVFGFFSDLLAEGVRVELVPGNHDVGLVRHLPREVTVHPSHGIVRDGVGIFHGHRWPSERVLHAARLVTGHLHPGVRFAPTPDAPAGKRRCWIRARLPPAPPARAGARRVVRAKELIVLPAFNPLAGTEALNRERPQRGRSFLYQRFLAGADARAYLLDGTDVGPVPTPVRPRPVREGLARAPSAR